MQMALDALDCIYSPLHVREINKVGEAMAALRTALAHGEQEPEPKPKCGAIVEVFGKDWRLEYMSLPVGKHKLYTQQYTYTAPPKREWQGLTDEEQGQVAWSCGSMSADWMEFARAIEEKLKGKNHG